MKGVKFFRNFLAEKHITFICQAGDPKYAKVRKEKKNFLQNTFNTFMPRSLKRRNPVRT